MTASTTSDWRASADPEDLREYDRFGPWIDKVTRFVDLPRRFRPWWPELSGAESLLKVPRPYDRAQMRPGMDLYATVVAVFPDRVCILRAEPADVVRRDIARDELVATIRHSNLLRGRWSMLLADGGIASMEFNSVSDPIIAELDDHLMRHEARVPSSHLPPASPPSDLSFRSVMAKLDTGATPSLESMRPIHVEEPGQPCRSDRNRRRRSAGMMILARPADLVIVNRDMAVQPLFRRANYAMNIVRIPYRRMTSMDIKEPERASPPRFSQLVITCDRQVITQPCLSRPGVVADLLAECGVQALG